MILDSGLNTDASFVVPPKGSDPANGPPGTIPVTITPIKANGGDDPMESLVGNPDFESDGYDGKDVGTGSGTDGVKAGAGGMDTGDL